MLGAVILCASELRLSWGAGIPELVRLVADTGYDGIAIGTRCSRGDVSALVTAATSARLGVPVVRAPLPERRPGLDKRLPYLASLDDADERRAALALFDATLDAVAPLGVRLFTVDLGEVALRTPAKEVVWRFARRELGEDEPGEAVWAAAMGERRARTGLILDVCRAALDRLLPRAERQDAIFALEVAGGPWGMPSPREALTLLDEYRDGPMRVVWDAASMQVLRTLGIAPSVEGGVALAAAAGLWRENEAVGIAVGYLPGLGDQDSTSTEVDSRFKQPPGIPSVVTGRRDSTRAEVEQARAKVAVTLGG